MSKTYLCPCGGETTVIDSRRASMGPAGIRRRRKCLTCDGRFTTYESTLSDSHQFVELLEDLMRKQSATAISALETSEAITKLLTLANASRELANARYGVAGPHFRKPQETQ